VDSFAAAGNKHLWPRSAGDVGAEILYCGVALDRGNREAFARVPRQRTSLTYVEAGYYYNLKCPTGAVCGCVLFDFGQVEMHDSYWSLCAATLFARKMAAAKAAAQVNEVHK